MEPEKKPNGAFVGLIVIIIILILGGMYIWQSNQRAAEEIKDAQVSDKDSAELDVLGQDLEVVDLDIGVDANEIH